MPLYEYRCLDCRKRSTILQLSVAHPQSPVCSHCRSEHVERLLSRFSSPKSEEARLQSLADPDHLGGLDEQDPQSMARFVRHMGQEMGEDVGDDLAEAMEGAPESAGDDDDLDSSDGL